MQIPQKYVILILMAFVNFTHIVDAMLIMPLGDIFIREFSIGAQEYAMLSSSYAFAAALSSFSGIFLIDKFDRKLVLLFMYFGFATGTLICGFCDTYLSLMITRFVTGLFGGMIGAIVLSIVSDTFSFQERGRAMGGLFAAFSAASALGIPLGIYLAAISTWQLPFIILGTFALFIGVMIFFLLPNMKGHLSQIDKHINFSSIKANILKDENQINAIFCSFVLIMAHFIIIPFISPYMIKNIGFTQKEVSFQFFLGGIFTLISAPIVGKLTDKLGVMKVFPTVMILSFIPTLFITHLTPVPKYYAFTLTTLFFIFATSRMISANTKITASAPISTRGSFMALNSTMQQLAIGLTGFISGNIVTIGLDGKYHNYNIIGYISIVLGLCTFYFIKKLKVADGNE